MNISELSEAIARDEIRVKTEIVDGQEFRIVCYMIASPDLWDVPNALECRGITFDSEGNCVCRTMEKFFNINENRYSQLANFNFNYALASDKLDGSMISIVRVNNKLYCKTKKSFYSSVALSAQEYFDTQPNLQALSNYMIDKGWTPTFEYESPKNQIVIQQTKEKMTLLLARHNETGSYGARGELRCLADKFNVLFVSFMNVTNISNLILLAKEAIGIEGWVVQLQHGQRIKLKTDWYLRLHRLTNYTERNIFDLVLSEEIDDLMPLLKTREGVVDKVNSISHHIAYLMKQAEIDTKHLVQLWHSDNLSLPDIGKRYSQHSAFSLAIKLYKNQEPDFKTFVIRNYRNQFTTTPLFWGFEVET